MSVKVTVSNGSSDYLTFGSANTPDAAKIGGYDDGSSAGHMEFYTTTGGTSTERMRIDANGNVGIGTGSPDRKLTIQADDTNALPSAATAQLRIQGSTNTAYQMYIGLDTTNGYGYIQPTLVGTAYKNLALCQGGGNVGIGTSSPSQKLNVQGNVLLTNPGNSLYTYYDSTATWTGRDSASGAYVIGVASSERMRIDSSGNVLIGTTSPTNTGKFNAATSSANQWAATFENQTVGYDTVLVQNHATSGNNRFIAFATEVAYTERGYIYYDRVAGQTKLSATSDYRAKDIVGDTTGALEKVSLMKVKDAKLKWAEGEAYPMFIAHELQEVAPWAVSGEKDAVDDEGKPQYQTVSYESLVATLTAAIQELKAELDTVKAELNTLKGA